MPLGLLFNFQQSKISDEGDIDGTTIDFKREIIQNNGTVTTPIEAK